MSSPHQGRKAEWVRCTPTFIKTLPVLKFPFEEPPDIYMPASTVLQLGKGSHVYAFKWCFLNRRIARRQTYFDADSLSAERVQVMPQVLERLSKWFRFKNLKPGTIRGSFNCLSRLLDWADQQQQGRRFEAVLSDPALALEALKGYHSYLRSQLQSHQISSATAGLRDQVAIACMSEIHCRAYGDIIEALEYRKGANTESPDSAAVAQFGSTLQAIFDSAAALILHGDAAASVRTLRTCASDTSKSVELREKYGPLRLMELACVSYAGLVIMDSGANLSVLTQYVEPEDLHEQLADPDRVNLKQKAIKFRAGGKTVEVFLSAVTVTRLKTYLQVRQTLIAALGGTDIAPLFIQCAYFPAKEEPKAVCPLSGQFLKHLRRKIVAVGATLPAVTLMQLRTYAQERFARTVPLPVAAQRMGHSVDTAIRAYCKAQEITRRGEMAEYLASLQRTVQDAFEARNESVEILPAGACASYGNPTPTPTLDALGVAPDCSKVEGCFFCCNYRVYADEKDMRKLMSCRKVLSAVAPLRGDFIRADRVYGAVVDRIDALLGDLRRRQPDVYEAVRVDVEERGQISGYWARKLQQLHLLGMLPSDTGYAR